MTQTLMPNTRGTWPRTSQFMWHDTIMTLRPDARALSRCSLPSTTTVLLSSESSMYATLIMSANRPPWCMNDSRRTPSW